MGVEVDVKRNDLLQASLATWLSILEGLWGLIWVVYFKHYIYYVKLNFFVESAVRSDQNKAVNAHRLFLKIRF